MLLVALVALLLIPGVARADAVTLHPGDRAPVDGVITRSEIEGAYGTQFQLETVQHRPGGGQIVIASGPMGGGIGNFGPGGLAMPRDAELVADGASPGTGVVATFEPDADGDLYGDDTRDQCPGDATSHIAPCTGVRSFGSPLLLRADPSGFSASGHPMDVLQTAGPAAVGAPIGGVVVRLRYRAATSDPLTLQVLHPVSGGAYQVAGEDTSGSLTAAGGVTTMPVRLPIAAGDRIGVRSPGDLSAVAARPAPLGEHVALLDPVPPVGSTATPGSNADFELLAQADVEPDADADGYGDVSQDTCPFDAARHAGCAADLAVTATTPEQVVPRGADMTFEFTVTNHGPDPAYLARLFLEPTGLDSLVATYCAGGPCEAARLDPGASLTGRWTLSGETLLAVGNTEGGGLSARAKSLTPDPDPSNDLATAIGRFGTTPGPTSPPPSLPTPIACANLLRGTTDDDFLRGTAFGDRIVGLDGRDLERGGPGDDCLEGGGGSDVMDGDGGNDRLSGGSGNDNMTGGAGDDKLTGGLGNDRVSAGPGNDTLLPGAGKDLVSAGAGNDTINAADGVRESIDCGAGRDTVRADRRDRLRGCEKVTRR
jgi:hypothetical protein